MGKKSGPPAPDYTGAAQAQAQASRETTTDQTWANRADMKTPWGSQTWNSTAAIDPATGKPVTKWTSNVQLSPDQQKALDSQQRIQSGVSGAAETLIGQATEGFKSPMNWDSLPARAQNIDASGFGFGANPLPQGDVRNKSFQAGAGPERINAFGFGDINRSVTPGQVQRQVGDAGQVRGQLAGSAGDFRQQAQDAVWNLQKPALDERRDSLETQLANMGLARGSEAWDREMRGVDDAEARARLAAIGEGRNESQMLFGQDLQAGQFENSAQGQRFGQELTRGQFANDATGQDLTQQIQAGQFGNAAQQQAFGQGVTGTTVNNAAAAQEFQQNQGSAAFENSAQQQEFTNLLQLAQQGDTRALAALQAQIQAGGFNNANRAGAIQEQFTRRGQGINELNALLTGQQVSQPSFTGQPGTTAGRAETPQLLDAATSQYGSALDRYNAKMGNINNLTNLATTAGTAFMFSDARLKEDVETAGVLSTGVRVVYYRYRGLPGRFVGVIAQELQQVQPEAVALDASGYLKVDYAKVVI